MLSWRLWRALDRAPSTTLLNPLLPAARPSHPTRNSLRASLIVIFALPTLCVSCLVFLAAINTPLVFVPVTVSLLRLILNGVLVSWAVRIGGLIEKQRTRGLWDLLAITPRGAFQNRFLLAHLWLYRSNRLRELEKYVRGLAALIGVIVILVVFGAASLTVNGHSTGSSAGGFATQNLQFAVGAFGLIVLLYVDFMQSCVFAVAAGIMDTVGEQRRVDARVLGAAFFSVVQVALVLGATLLTARVLPNLFAALRLYDMRATFLALALQFGIVIGGREWVLRTLWRRLTRGDDPLLPETTP